MNLNTLLVPLFSLALAGCSSVKMTSYKDPRANITAHPTFNWAEEKASLEFDPESNDRFVGGYLQLSAESDLASKGYEKSAQPELTLGFHVSLDRALSVAKMDARYNYTYAPHYLLQSGGLWQPEPVDIRTDMILYGKGTVVLDVFDASSNTLIWRASTATRVHESLSRTEREIRLQNAVRLLLSAYPSR